MRKGTVNAYEAWTNNRRWKRQESLWTDGLMIYSYSTPILWRDSQGHLTIDARKYSVTTTVHQNGLRELLRRDFMAYIVL